MNNSWNHPSRQKPSGDAPVPGTWVWVPVLVKSDNYGHAYGSALDPVTLPPHRWDQLVPCVDGQAVMFSEGATA